MQAPRSSGLTGHWTMDGRDITTRVEDKSGAGRHGYFVNAATSSMLAIGKLGQGTVYDGTNDYITTDTALSNFISASNATVAIWLAPTGATEADAASFTGAAAIGDRSGFIGIYRTSIAGTDRIWAFNWDANGEDRAGATYNVDEWTHIALVHTGGTLSIYKNGAFAHWLQAGTRKT